ncbi:hypothetical protein [Polaribacter sp. L3A8]|uniref:hypothetical protein n=1 Tax=Polaribacter sp. L3A8 TaxID=2686361 RepID=UPI00131D686C|nr:hypothetical protein [Polaribacter sp. L3A8]
MNIVYNIVIPIISALVGGMFSVWVFNKGLARKIKEERCNRIKNNYQIEEYFFYNLRAILCFIDRQVNGISETSQNTKNWYNKNLTLVTFSELKMTELRELDFKLLFQILVIDRIGKSEKKAHDFIDIKNCLHNIEDFVEKHKKENEKFQIELEKHLDNWNNSIQRLMQLYNHFVFLKPNEDDKLMPILKKHIFTKQTKLTNKGIQQNMEIFYKSFILPLKKDILVYKNLNDERILPIIDNIIECQNSYQQTKNLRYQRRKNLLFSGRRLISVKHILKKSLESIEKRKKKRID